MKSLLISRLVRIIIAQVPTYYSKTFETQFYALYNEVVSKFELSIDERTLLLQELGKELFKDEVKKKVGEINKSRKKVGE